MQALYVTPAWHVVFKSSIFVVQKATEPKNGVEFRQGSIGTIGSSLATSYDVWRRRQFSTNQRPRNCLRQTENQHTVRPCSTSRRLQKENFTLSPEKDVVFVSPTYHIIKIKAKFNLFEFAKHLQFCPAPFGRISPNLTPFL